MTKKNIDMLPELSYSFLETNEPGKQVIAIRRGMAGYQLTTFDDKNPEHAKLVVKKMNEKLGVNPIQAECMLAGSMFGWDSKAADYQYAVAQLGANPHLSAFDPAGRVWSPVEALSQAQAALPDNGMALIDGVSPELIRLIEDTLERAKDGEVSNDEIMGVLIKAREALPGAWENHGGSPVELLEEIDRAISGNSTNIFNAQNIVKEIASKFGISLTAWVPNDAFAGPWEFADAEFEGKSIRLGASGGGVVQVNRDPFTPTGDRVPNVTIDAIEASIMAAANIHFAKPDRTYVGTLIHQADKSIAVQNVGKGLYVAHDSQVSKGLKKGTSYTIKYDSQGKVAQIKPKTKGSEELTQGI
ncbi:KfrB domain-containing protein [Methylovorus glucosotrophus]|uniref:KfrB domain-containing protein n=1 Tax=Methylovorus glucosotrophus (strain SIP3-4) TaxID=582744 RepID=C6XEM4_METGS|nr:KfrB domain-containing protein [Methylovorus glucosotrophus]ACT52081.1 hypothetical protein Msip34_2857 [Methylovorus glucosotrophus SIP3-4]